MPIRRPRGPKVTLRHVEFLSALERVTEQSSAAAGLRAGFLTLRLLDEWMSVGDLLAAPDGIAHRQTRDAVAAIAQDAELRVSLERILDGIAMLCEPDAQPVLPRVFAYGSLLEFRGHHLLAADVYGSVTRYVDPRAHVDLALDALMKQGFCYRTAGDYLAAERAYEQAGMLAGRTRDRARVLYARIGEVKVEWGRGNLKVADEALGKLREEAATLGDSRLEGVILHELATVARLRDDLPRAIRQAYDAFRLMAQDDDRERVLSDLGNFLGLSGAFDTARAALTVLATGGRAQETRWIASINLMDLAAREGSETRFEQQRRALVDQPLPGRIAAGYFRDAALGLARFDRVDEARNALDAGMRIARDQGHHQILFELEALASRLEAEARQRKVPAPAEAPADIASAIERLLQDSGAALR